jgi:tRNA 2-thiocytidine biosynthesis protein TtcA
MNIATTVKDDIDIEAEDGGSAVHPMFFEAPALGFLQ